MRLAALGRVTTITTYLPPLLRRYTSSNALIGLVLALESGFALLFPLVVGPWSDRARTPLGRRRPFMLAGLAPLLAGLAAVAFVPGLVAIALVLAPFFVGVYLFESPYRSLYSDLLQRQVFGRAQGIQHVLRGAAIGGALVAGGFLFALRRPLPFLASAAIVAMSCGLLLIAVREPRPAAGSRDGGLRRLLSTPLRILARDAPIRRYLVANSVWEGAFAGLRAFVVLDITRGLHQRSQVASLALACVAAGYLLAALGASRFGDRFGLARVIFAASLVYGAALSLAVLATAWHDWYYPLIVPAGFAGGTVMTLSGGLLYIMPTRNRGATTGLATSSRALGLLIGPLAVGGAIDATRSLLRSTHGYAAMWPTIGLPILLASPLLLSLHRAEAAKAPGRGHR